MASAPIIGPVKFAIAVDYTKNMDHESGTRTQPNDNGNSKIKMVTPSTEDEVNLSEGEVSGNSINNQSESEEENSVTLGSNDTSDAEDEELGEATERNADSMTNSKSDGDATILGSDDTAMGIEDIGDDELAASNTEELLINHEEVDELDSGYEEEVDELDDEYEEEVDMLDDEYKI
ncbi:hypothetical protein PCASD_15798 [Puccinia coronata f. sp. avenae]|uniref:Uncharacterized protein n=1 Tax=Puccinia coronata f. sp. avenae TaxID=200324 RepID=A0A2N5TTR0_9BASI|nr:hypothetical protein PCASD_15798 [Puccinia coronata f. sp. avenae]